MSDKKNTLKLTYIDADGNKYTASVKVGEGQMWTLTEGATMLGAYLTNLREVSSEDS